MIREIIAKFILATLTSTLFPSDGSALEALATNKPIDTPIIGEQGKLFNYYEQQINSQAPVKTDDNSLGVITSAKSTIVVDDATGIVLFGERPYDVRSIGSVTKLMAAMVFLDTYPDLDKIVTLNSKTDLVVGGREYLAFGDGVALRDVLGASLVGSDNSTTQSLVRFAGMTNDDFIKKMNNKAQTLGLSKTYFTDPTGIQATNVSTAHEVVGLLRAARTYPDMVHFMQQPKISITQASGHVATIDTTNDALVVYSAPDSPYRIMAGKTGFLPEAGYVLASMVENNNHALDVVVMGAESKEARSKELRGLAEWTFGVFKWPK